MQHKNSIFELGGYPESPCRLDKECTLKINAMTRGTLHWDDWYRSEGCRHHMDRNYFAGIPFTSIFYDAMRTIEKEIPSGRLFIEAEKLIAKNSPVGFSKIQAEKLLYYGRFTFGQGTDRGTLTFKGPALPEDNDAWGVTPFAIGGPFGDLRIRIHFYNLISYANSDPVNFPKNQYGIRRLAVLTGAVVLHEVMHVEGFNHGDAPSTAADDKLSHPYNRTLCEVAGQAFGNIFYKDFPFLNGEAALPHVKCGTHKLGLVPDGDSFADQETPVFCSQLDYITNQESFQG